MSHAPQRLVVVSAGLSEPSSTSLLGERIASATLEALKTHGQEATVTVVNLRPLATAIAHHMLSHTPSAELQAAITAVVDADALIAVTPTFNGSYSGLFKSFFDIIEAGQLDGIPTALAATGGSARHSLMLDFAMRPLFTYLRSTLTPTSIYAATEDWGSSDSGLPGRITRVGTELAGAIIGTPRHRASDPFDESSGDFEDFASLLGGAR
ncbi:CE1759 family FMN reductase [Humidisolicoccus flavus]|uniref:CE1759 family FMN reductase n=1 Tax=Humidisolicoccus flavus TaxID=3111414 RepID=UPI00324309D1